MAIVEFSVPWSLVTPAGTLELGDQDAADGFVLIPEQCDAGADLRFSSDGIPAGDGEIIRQSFDHGYTLRVAAEMFTAGAIAVGEDRRLMFEELLLHLNAIKRADGRVKFTPTGASDDRLLNKVRLIERPTGRGGLLKTVTFAVMSKFPYLIDESEQTDALADGVEATVTNAGNANEWPVYRVAGPVSAFEIVNATAIDQFGNPLRIVYDDSLPGAVAIGGGDYAEIDTFAGTVTLNGDVAFLHAGIDWTLTDMPPLVPGGNLITITGTTADLLHNNAYA